MEATKTKPTSNAKERQLPYGVFAEAGRRLGLGRHIIYEAWANERPDVVDTIAAIIAEMEAEKRRVRNLKAAIIARSSKLAEAENIQLHDEYLRETRPELMRDYTNS